ncbi:hypothetical protein ACPW96_21275 [Micromonospora sp. DT81.3]|uniref:hypothetical protein n=1 Tax=Micromonospora sp. DT81.3 TaxID=3416523 RepID=UPI003CEB4431
MSLSLNFNEGEFKRQMAAAAQSGLQQLAREQTSDFDRLRQQYTGRPVEEIRPALQRLFARYDGKITEPELTEWAQMISDGTPIEFKPEKIRW